MNEQKKFSINDDDVLTLAKWAVKIEEHYNFPQDIEWAKDGKTGELFIVQSRPETVETEKKEFILQEFIMKNPPLPLLKGIAIGGKVASGKARVIKSVAQLSQFERGEILITKMTDPDWVPVIRLASAVITDEGSRVCFAGDTKILTNKGFLTIKEIVENIKENKTLQTLSFNKEKMVLEWKRIIDGFQKHSNLIRVGFSQTGRMKDNYIESTPDHKFLTFQNRDLISKEIKDIIKNKEGVISVYKIPQLSTSDLNSKKANRRSS